MDVRINLINVLSLILVVTSRGTDATCYLPMQNGVWEYNYTKVSDNLKHSTTLIIGTTTLQNSVIHLDAYGTTIDDWTCINSKLLSNTEGVAVFKSDTSFTSGPFSGNRRLYLCMKLTKVTNDLYYFYILSDIFPNVTPKERVYASKEGNAPDDDAPMCSTFCQYTGSPKIRTLIRQGTSDEIPGDAALCEPCDSTCEVDRCDPNPCQNNGSCKDFKDGYNCKCTSGWKGENCTTAKTSSSVGWIVVVVSGVTVVVVAVVVLVIIVVVLRKRRKSTFGVTKRNINTSSDDHKNGENELKEVEQKLVAKT
ncbi:uncharacterized protein LOC127714525 [Mytilus californianus]|uniref:uncharacterized protein LOC127714525 n=1 Tax=Mytilus californianus TaxID=6549 RepID=UPI0022484537|nr:uncharacterized protein LOC127714525 [Mytilus californianus]